jgi:hypothetical protein
MKSVVKLTLLVLLAATVLTFYPRVKPLVDQALFSHQVHDIGENIWSGSGYDPGKTQELAKEIVNDWLSSPGTGKICSTLLLLI